MQHIPRDLARKFAFDWRDQPLLRVEPEEIFQHTPGPSGTTRDGTLHFDDKRSWPITPFVGTLGVAPDREVTTSLDGQGEWGGNLDIRDVAS